MRPVITVVAARPMSEVGFRAVQASAPTVNQSATDPSDRVDHYPNQADETLQSRPAPPVTPRIIRPSFTQEGTETPSGQHMNEPLQNLITHPTPPAKSHSLTPGGQFVPPVPPRSHVPTDLHEEENIVNDLLDRTSPVSLSPASRRPTIISPASRRPTIISPAHSCKVLSTHTDHSCTTGETTVSETEAPTRAMQKTRPTIIGFPRHQPHPQGESGNGRKDTPLTGSFTNGGIAEKTNNVCGFLQTGVLAARKGIKERYDASPLNRHQSEPETVKTNPLAANKPILAPKPQLKPKPGFQRGSREHEMPQGSPTLTAASVEKTTAPVVEKATKQTFDVVQKHTEKSVQQAIMTKFVTPHLGSSQFVQKRTAPLVEKATNQMYSSAQKQAETSVQKAIVSTVVGQQPQSTGTRVKQGASQQALPAGLLHKTVTASSVEKATAPTVERATKQSFSVLQKHTEKSVQQAIMSKVVTPHLGSSKFVQKRSAPLVAKATNQMYASAEKQAEASVQKTIVSTVVGHQLGPSEPEQTPRALPSARNQARAAESPDVPVARRKLIAGSIKSKLARARPKSMSFDVLKHKDERADHGRTQPSVGHDDVRKKKPPPRPTTGPQGPASKLLSHTRSDRREDSPWGQPISPPNYDHGLSLSPPKYNHREQTTRPDVPHGVAVFDYIASQPDELSFLAGDTVTLLRKVDDQWFYGQTRGEEGIFPSGFIDVVVPIPDDGIIHTMCDATYPSQPASDYHPSNGHTTGGKHGEDNCSGVKVAALYTFTGEPGELSFVTGAAICVHGKLTRDWLYGELHGDYGSFPSSFVSVAMETLPQLDLDSMYGVAGPGTTGVDNSREQPGAVSGWEDGNSSIANSWEAQGTGYETTGDQLQEVTYCIAQHPFSGESGEDLTFDAGDRITLLAYIDSDWLKGSLNGREGIFPKAFVDIIEDSSNDATYAVSGATVHGHMTSAETVATHEDTAHKTYPTDTYPEFSGSVARALFDFTGDTEEDLCFKCGQEIEVLEWVNDAWMKGRLAGRTGIFPANFVEIIEK